VDISELRIGDKLNVRDGTGMWKLEVRVRGVSTVFEFEHARAFNGR